jgi:hypothetical protein
MVGKCAAYWRARESGKDCGVPSSKSATSAQERYLEVIDELVGMGADRDNAFDHIPYSLIACSGRSGRSGKLVPFISLRRDSPIRKHMIDYIFQCVISNERINYGGLIAASGVDISKWTEDDYKNNYTSGGARRVINGKRLGNFSYTKAMKSVIGGDLTRLNTFRSVSGNRSLTEKLQSLTNICTSGQLGILQKMNAVGYGDNEYTSFSIALKWAAERLESEKPIEQATA